MIEPNNIEPCFNCGIIDRYCQKKITEELEKIKEEIEKYGSIWVQYSIKGHTNKDIEDIVNDVLKQAKQSFIQRLDNRIAELKGE